MSRSVCNGSIFHPNTEKVVLGLGKGLNTTGTNYEVTSQL